MMASRDEVMAALAGVPGPDRRTPLPGRIAGLPESKRKGGY